MTLAGDHITHMAPVSPAGSGIPDGISAGDSTPRLDVIPATLREAPESDTETISMEPRAAANAVDAPSAKRRLWQAAAFFTSLLIHALALKSAAQIAIPAGITPAQDVITVELVLEAPSVPQAAASVAAAEAAPKAPEAPSNADTSETETQTKAEPRSQEAESQETAIPASDQAAKVQQVPTPDPPTPDVAESAPSADPPAPQNATEVDPAEPTPSAMRAPPISAATSPLKPAHTVQPAKPATPANIHAMPAANGTSARRAKVERKKDSNADGSSSAGKAKADTTSSQSVATASAGEKAAYFSRLLAHVQAFKHYPAGTGATGTARVSITIDRSGNFRGARLIASAGNAILDNEASAVARRAAPYPPPPQGVGGSTFSFSVALRFSR